MPFIDKLKAKTPTLSYEFFPPKNPSGWGTLYSSLGAIGRQAPDFVSVTYGAGGSTRQKTVELVGRIQSELGIETVAHLTCVGHSQSELHGILEQLEAAGVKTILALRGDRPKNDPTFTPHPEGFGRGCDLVDFIRQNFGFHIGCAFYPEKHPESSTVDLDIEILKAKQDVGADFAVSQLFFDNETFYQFRDRAAAAGVTLPLIAGIMPVTSLSQLPRFSELGGSQIPAKLTDFLGEGSDEEIVPRGVEYAAAQCRDLIDNGVAGVHLYTLNKSVSSVKVTQALRASGHLPKVTAGK
jgi:methylenetetrahydrofolate reductase (NADPH)